MVARPLREQIGEEVIELDGRRFAILQELSGSRWYFMALNRFDPLYGSDRVGRRTHRWKYLAVNALKGYLRRWAGSQWIPPKRRRLMEEYEMKLLSVESQAKE